MKPVRRLSLDERGYLIALAAVLLGGWEYLYQPAIARFPINDGGLFYVMIRAILLCLTMGLNPVFLASSLTQLYDFGSFVAAGRAVMAAESNPLHVGHDVNCCTRGWQLIKHTCKEENTRSMSYLYEPSDQASLHARPHSSSHFPDGFSSISSVMN